MLLHHACAYIYIYICIYTHVIYVYTHVMYIRFISVIITIIIDIINNVMNHNINVVVITSGNVT